MHIPRFPRFPRFPQILVALAALAMIALPKGHGAEPFEIRAGDRVLLIGDTLLEREGTFGAIESRMQAQFPERHFTVRNLAFSADTPLGWSRASFDPADKGFARVKEQLAMVRPTVAILGYGMAASLQEITDRSGDVGLNPDPARYGQPMSAERFKAELAQLMDEIASNKPDGATAPVRFVLLAPIRHEDLRHLHPGFPDPARHNELLAAYSKKIEELATERGATFITPLTAAGKRARPLTDNGIHPDAAGMEEVAASVATGLGWNAAASKPGSPALRQAIVRKNELFFHRWRPANSTYIFGFRKHEQGRNAAEIPQFDPLIEKVEAEIDILKTAKANVAAPVKPAAPAFVPEPGPQPQFQIAEGYQIELWAQNPLLEKPTQMNWDAQGRLWVCSSSLYPMIAPGGEASDKILILEDSDHNGTADKSTVFAGGLLIPTGVEPALAGSGKKPNSAGDGCYVGQSTELLYLEDKDGNGEAEHRRVVFSGFGTEDTHHILHTLQWGADGRLYFNQSIYIHSHIETPWGVVRLNSGGVFAYDPSTERLEVFHKGFYNPWGQQMDKWGQSFQSDGAGFTGVTWGIPGAVFAAYEGGRRIFPSVSPGTYPKMCGLELIYSPHFPADWQGNAVTCDFRAHRIVRFAFEDLAAGANPKTAYLSKEQPDFVRTSDVDFRPIDLKMGPDGALYIADWSNPVINHGEVDFRDPRRDHHMGRIWRITRKESPVVKWQPLRGNSNEQLLDQLGSVSLWEREQAIRTLQARGGEEIAKLAAARVLTAKTPELQLAYANLQGALQPANSQLWKTLATHPDFHVRAAAMRQLSSPQRRENDVFAALVKGASDPNPRVRLEAIRSLGKFPLLESVSSVLAVGASSSEDVHLGYAAWLSINELSKSWVEAVANGQWKLEGHEKELEFGLDALDPNEAGKIITTLLKDRQIPRDGSGPWINLLGKSGQASELSRLFEQLASKGFELKATVSALKALSQASRIRKIRPANFANPEDPTQTILALLESPDRETKMAAAHLAGFWKIEKASEALAKLAIAEDAGIRAAAFEGVRELAGAIGLLEKLVAADQPIAVRRLALTTMAQVRLASAVEKAPEIFAAINDETGMLETWRGLLQGKDAAAAFAKEGARFNAPLVAGAGVRAAREIGKRGVPLIDALNMYTKAAQPGSAKGIEGLVELIKSKGDAARGELIYRRPNYACVTCHAIGGAGGKVGPELTSMGASAPLDYIIESVMNPAAKVKEGYNAVSLTMKDGSLVTGIQVRDTGLELYLRDVMGLEQPIVKANITARHDIGSMMPAGLIDALPENERADLFAFLAQLGKAGEYDASQGKVARVWNLYPASEQARVLKGDLQKERAASVMTLVNGRLNKATLAEAVTGMGVKDSLFYAVSQFQGSGKIQVNLTGTTKVWLDGKAVTTAELAADLAAGTHTIILELDSKNLPEVIRAESPDARFLGN